MCFDIIDKKKKKKEREREINYNEVAIFLINKAENEKRKKKKLAYFSMDNWTKLLYWKKYKWTYLCLGLCLLLI